MRGCLAWKRRSHGYTDDAAGIALLARRVPSLFLTAVLAVTMFNPGVPVDQQPPAPACWGDPSA